MQFKCKLTSPFHSSEQNYSNLYTCAPYVLGTTIRGAVLRTLIDKHCKALESLQDDNPGYHKKCEQDCPVRPLFLAPTRFSFGMFDQKRAYQGMRTRVGINRNVFAAAEEALLSLEVHYGEFCFQVMYPTLDTTLEKELSMAVIETGQRLDDGGIGRLRSVGWGRYEVLSYGCIPLEHREGGYQKYYFNFKTPYILEKEAQSGEIPPDLLTRQLNEMLKTTSLPDVKVVDVQAHILSLSYLRRWSDERKQKENYVVAQSGSKLTVTFDDDVPEDALQLWEWGIGKFWYAGFGSFESKRVNDTQDERTPNR
jgi:hypothetical protein